MELKKYFENDEILSIVWRWKRELGMVFIASFLISAIVSSPLIITPKYRSYARVYPSNLNEYSEESYSEQMLQMLESDVIRDKLIKEFKLEQHYEIEPDDKHRIDLLHKKYDENVRFTKTKYESVEIEVIDESPDLAYKMLKRLIVIFNEQVKAIQDIQSKEAVHTLNYAYNVKLKEIDSLETRLNFLRDKYGILDFKSQVKNLSKEYYKLLASGTGGERMAVVKGELNALKLKGTEFERLNHNLEVTRKESSKIKIELDAQSKELLRYKNFANIVVNGYKSDKKVYPVRWLIISISVGSCLLFAFGVISFIDRVNQKAQ